MSILTETEVKTVAASRGLSEQIASSQIRTGRKDALLVIVEGRQGVKKGGKIVFEGEPTRWVFKPEQIVYNPHIIKRSGVTLNSANRWAQKVAEGEITQTKGVMGQAQKKG